MKTKKILQTTLTWIPSIPIVYFFVENGIDKILNSGSMDKLGMSSNTILLVGVILLLATGLFLYRKTVVVGTGILALYMTAIVFIHISKGKPFILATLIVLLTLFAGYVRKTKLFHKI